MGSPAVGASELQAIHQAIGRTNMKESSSSPAAVARELANAGAELRHPEIIEYDARWREAQLRNEEKEWSAIARLLDAETGSLNEAEETIAQLEKLRAGFTMAADETALNDLRTLVIEARNVIARRAAERSAAKSVGAVQAEIAEWLRVWLETPELFRQWLDLRKASQAFAKEFAER